MEQGIDDYFRTVCSACLSSDRDLITINPSSHLLEIFRLLLGDTAGDRLDDTLCVMEVSLCWECHAVLQKCANFKKQVQNAQEHLRLLALSQSQESLDHTYMAQSLSSLVSVIKRDYDRIYVEYSNEQDGQWSQSFPYITITTPQGVKNEGFDITLRDHISLAMDEQVSEVPELVLKNPLTGAMSHIVVGTDALVSSADFAHSVKSELAEFAIDASTLIVTEVNKQTDNLKEPNEPESKRGYITEYMTEADMLACREDLKKKISYASAVYKCELCIMEFYLQQQVEDHFKSAHRARPNTSPCKICYVYVDEAKLQAHTDAHYTRHTCKLCAHTELSSQLIAQHVQAHLDKKLAGGVIQIGDAIKTRRKKKTVQTEQSNDPPKPGDLRRLLSRTTIVGYKCLECDMFFKNSRARKNHVARFHREGLQCDHCKKRFVNKTTLATHLRLHEGPLPREKCPVCNKMVRVVQLKYHIQRHESIARFECRDCDKVFSHLATFQAHLKYSRAHATEGVFKYPCPMCNKGYPTKEAMQDHFNYQHLGKTTHKCPICEKPIASKANVEKHIMRVHREKREKPKNHVCGECGKGFTDKKALNQHAVIHSGERPLSCDMCSQTFKQKASLYTHKKRVHKMLPPKRRVEFMERGN